MSKIALLKTKSFQFIFIIALVAGIGFAFAVDTDNDGMSDLYEEFFHLNPTNATDALENYDSDTLTNLTESLIWTDPYASDTDADGFDDGADDNPLSRAVIDWGHPDFTTGDEYAYTGPDWWLGAGKSGGVWTNGACWLVSSNAQGSIYMDLDRTLLTEDIVLNLLHQDASNSWVYLDLVDATGNVVATNLFGDLTGDADEQVLRRYALPLADYPTASRILIDAQAGSEPYKVWITTLYVDADFDGLDADQEIQSGTLDTNPDFDSDDLSDYVEVIITHTLPTNPDTDNDGFSDGEEVNIFGSDPTVPAWQEGGIPGTLQVERWNNIGGGRVSDLLDSDRFGGTPDERTWVGLSEYAKNKGGSYGIRVRGTITAPAAGDYTFFLTGDDTADLWLSEDGTPYQRKKILDLAGWTHYRQLSNWKVHPSEVVTLTSNQTCYVELLFKEGGGGDHVTLWWQRPGTTEPEIITAEYLRSYAQPADDQDQDGLPDALETAGGLDPQNGIGGGYLDTDGDGFSDHEEINFLGTSPTLPTWRDGGIAGVLQVEQWTGISGGQVSDLLSSDRFGNAPDQLFWISTSETPQNIKWNYGLRIRGTITAPSDGIYTFNLTGDDTARVWLSTTDSPYQRKQILDLAGYTGYRDLSSPNAPVSAPVLLTSNQTYYVEILMKEGSGADHVSFWWTRPGETTPEIIASEYLHSYVQPTDDLDGDGLPDALETAGGLDPLDGTGGGYLDSDGDGLSDHEEINVLGTNPGLTDTDGDTISDSDEIAQGSSPILPVWQEGGLAGVLQVEQWNDMHGTQVSDLLTSVRFGATPDAISWISTSESLKDVGANYGLRIRGTITAPVDGSYTFNLTGDDTARVWLSTTDSPYQRQPLLDLAGYTGYRELTNANASVSAPVLLASNQTYYVEILFKEAWGSDHVSLWWTRPGESDPEIIASEYLHSYIQPSDDLDGDALPDTLETANGLDPFDGIGGGHLDADADGFFDHEELNFLGSNPLVPIWEEGGIAGVLQVERWNDLGGLNLLDLTGSERFGNTPDEFVWVAQTEYAEKQEDDRMNAGGYYGIRMRGTLTIPTAGDYTFYLTADDAAQVWLSTNENPCLRQQILELKDWVTYQDLSSPKVHASAPITLAANQTCYLEILLKEAGGLDHVTLWWTRPGETEPEIIGSEYLHSYLLFADDLDMDGLSDAWETANGLDPLDGTGGGYLDADGDGYSDIEEFHLGTSLVGVDADGDGLKDGDELTITLTDPNMADTDADGIADRSLLLHVNGAEIDESVSTHINARWEIVGDSIMSHSVYSSPTVTHEINIATAGVYQVVFYAHSANETNRPSMVIYLDDHYVDHLTLNTATNLPGYTGYTGWLTPGTHRLTAQLVGIHYFVPFTIDAFELHSIDGVDADGNGVQDWMEAQMPAHLDTDVDGLSDSDEVFLYGTDPLNADSDGDGLLDGEEIEHGTDPLDEDSDDDGVSDGIEINELYTNPLIAEFNGTVDVVTTLTGSQTNLVAGDWEIQGTQLLSKSRRGFVEYEINFPASELYCLKINAAHQWNKSSCTPVLPVDTSHLQIYIDGLYVGNLPFVSADDVDVDVRSFLPIMPAGNHTVRIFWENVHGRLALQINTLELQKLGGPDANNNGIKDWVENTINQTISIDAVPAESYISPLCIEGNARYVSLMDGAGILYSTAWITGMDNWWFGGIPMFDTLAALKVSQNDTFGTTNQNVALRQSAGDRWYANLPLNEEGPTTALLSFQNETLVRRLDTEWVPFSAMEHDGETLQLRQGDSLRIKGSAGTSWFPARFTLTLDGTQLCSNQTDPYVLQFNTPGIHIVVVQEAGMFGSSTGTVTIEVIGGTFPEESPACLVGREREWSFEGMNTNVVFETDTSVEFAVLETSLTTNNQSQITVALRATKTNGDHTMLARLYENGPILDSTQLDTFWIQNAVDGRLWVVERYEDSELWEVDMVTKQVPDTVDLEIKVVIAGVTLDDYTLERWLTHEDLDEIGEYRFRLYHPNEVETSACHTVKLYQDGVFIGEAFYNGQTNIGEE